jgi:hypothetical protein
MILLGVVAIALPLASGIAVSELVAWIIVISGLAYLASAFAGRNAGAFIWRMLIGLVFVGGGGYLAFHSGIALESLTLVMAIIFALEGVLEIVVFFQFRTFTGSGWVLFDAIVTLLLAFIIMRPGRRLDGLVCWVHRFRPFHSASHRRDLLSHGKRDPGSNPSGLRYVLCNGPVPPSLPLRQRAQEFAVRGNHWPHPVSLGDNIADCPKEKNRPEA